jgi:endogenous inhibitor of DNA gyrase (YacG/DUF329 family)
METLISKRRKLPYTTFHECPECGKDFYGRENKIYCSPQCKINSNNAKAAKMSVRVSEQVKMLKRNAQILDEFYSVESIPLVVDKVEFIKKGFIIDSPSISLKTKDGVQWQMIGRFVFRSEVDSSGIHIMTKDDLDNI